MASVWNSVETLPKYFNENVSLRSLKWCYSNKHFSEIAHIMAGKQLWYEEITSLSPYVCMRIETRTVSVNFRSVVDSKVQRNVRSGSRKLYLALDFDSRRSKKGKGFPYSIPSAGPGADPGVQAVSLQVTISHPPGGRLPLLSARPAVTFPAAEHHRPLAGTKLYCLVTEAHRCKQLA